MAQLNLSLHHRQTEAFQSNATEILYGGAAGGGKSHLMRVAAAVWCTEIPGIQVYLFRRLSDDLFKNHMTGPGSFPELLAPWMGEGLVKYNGSKNYLEWWNGSKIWLCHCQHEKDMVKYQGAEIHVLLIDELTHFSETIYRFLRGRCRLGGLKIPEKYAGMFPRIINGSNPGGVGHTFVRRTFIAKAPPMAVMQMPKTEGGMRRQYIPAKLNDNPTLLDNDPDYILRLEGLGNPALVKAMRDGDWNIVAGGAVDDLWDECLILPRFAVPKGWRVDRSMDWGSAKPFSVGWWAEADGTEARFPDGRIFCPVKGSLIRIHEWYGSPEVGSNVGTRMGARAVARGILAKEAAMRNEGWVQGTFHPGPADNSIRNVAEEDDTDSIERLMSLEHVKWTDSDKTPGSRVIGLELLRDRMGNAKKGEGVAIYFCEHCVATTGTLPVLPRDSTKPEDVDTNAEDHVYDEIRYRVLSNAKRYATAVTVRYPT